MQVLFHHESADRHTEVGSPSTILHVYGDGYLRVIHRREAHEHGVVVATVLGGTGLAARLEVIAREHLTSASHRRTAHAGYHIVVSSLGSLCVMTAGIERVERLALHLAHHVRHIVIASVGDGGAQVGYLQRREVYLALSDGDTDDGQSVPRAMVSLVVELGVRNQTSFLARKVDAQLIAEAHAHHVVLPGGHRLLHVLVLLAVAHHIVESPTEVTVTRGTDGIHQCDRRRVTVTSHV